MSLPYLEIPTWQGFSPLCLLSVGVLLQYSGFILSQILFQEKGGTILIACFNSEGKAAHIVSYRCMYAPNKNIKLSSHSNTMKKNSIRTTFATVCPHSP